MLKVNKKKYTKRIKDRVGVNAFIYFFFFFIPLYNEFSSNHR